MFKSSENLRLAAEMRALERVARPWRQARTSWFDGTPESLEARIAQTDRVLSYARSGFTTAHLTLAREASAARAELLDAKHRLLTDFLDDGARAFKGSKREASDLTYIRPEDFRGRGNGNQYDQEGRHQEVSNNTGGWDYGTTRDNGLATSYGGNPLDSRGRVMENIVDEDGHHRILDKQNTPYKGKHRAEGSRRVAEKDGDPGSRWPGGPTLADHLNRLFDKWDNSKEERGLRECINCGGALSGEQDEDEDAECGTCGMSAHQKGVDWRRKGGSRRTAGSKTTDLGGGASIWDIGPTETMSGTESLSLPGAIAKGIANGAFMTGQEDTPAFNPGPKVASLDEPCGDCGASPGEPCDEDCINHEDYDKRHQVPPELAWMADAVRNYPGPNPYHNHSHGPEHHRPYDDDPDSRYAARTRTTRRSR